MNKKTVETKRFCNLLCMEIFTTFKDKTIENLNKMDFSFLKDLSEDEQSLLKKQLHYEMETFFLEQIRMIKEEHYHYNLCDIEETRAKLAEKK